MCRYTETYFIAYQRVIPNCHGGIFATLNIVTSDKLVTVSETLVSADVLQEEKTGPYCAHAQQYI